ncbi:hypothetical protein IAR55_005175 [Kwoniella newhampshirensis]|uniref:Uncharacterized protein n=1 Tax=Kwoniella newhampshirensis TaxID=1651941 RepID=A0AAW0YJM7_9TREE
MIFLIMAGVKMGVTAGVVGYKKYKKHQVAKKEKKAALEHEGEDGVDQHGSDGEEVIVHHSSHHNHHHASGTRFQTIEEGQVQVNYGDDKKVEIGNYAKSLSHETAPPSYYSATHQEPAGFAPSAQSSERQLRRSRSNASTSSESSISSADLEHSVAVAPHEEGEYQAYALSPRDHRRAIRGELRALRRTDKAQYRAMKAEMRAERRGGGFGGGHMGMGMGRGFGPMGMGMGHPHDMGMAGGPLGMGARRGGFGRGF